METILYWLGQLAMFVGRLLAQILFRYVTTEFAQG